MAIRWRRSPPPAATTDLSNKPAIPAQGSHIVAGTMQGNTAQLTGNSSDQTIYTASLPAGTFATGQGVKCSAAGPTPAPAPPSPTNGRWAARTVAYGSLTSGSQNFASDIEIYTISSLTSRDHQRQPDHRRHQHPRRPQQQQHRQREPGQRHTIKFTFNMPNTDWVKGSTFYCQTIQ